MVIADAAAWAGQLRYLDQVLVDADRRRAARGDGPRGPRRGGTRGQLAEGEKTGRETRSCPFGLVDLDERQ